MPKQNISVCIRMLFGSMHGVPITMNKGKAPTGINTVNAVVGQHSSSCFLHYLFHIFNPAVGIVSANPAGSIFCQIPKSLVVIAPQKDSFLTKFKKLPNKLFSTIPILLQARSLFLITSTPADRLEIPKVANANDKVWFKIFAECEQSLNTFGALLVSVYISASYKFNRFHLLGFCLL